MQQNEQLPVTVPDMMNRLASLEAELQSARARLEVLEQGDQRGSKRTFLSRRAAFGLSVVVLASALGGTLSQLVQAQAQTKPAKPAGKVPSKTNGPKGHVVRAPFSVVDAQGKVIIRVQDADSGFKRGIAVLNPQGNRAVGIGTADNGSGFVALRDGKGLDGSNAAFLFDNQGDVALSMWGADGKKFFGITATGLQIYENDAVVANLGIGEQGGKMSLCNFDGVGVVEAGILPGNRGVVRTFPTGGPATLTIPNFIMGANPK